MKSYVRAFLILLLLSLIGFVLVKFYPYIFSRRVSGEVMGVERVAISVALMQTQDNVINPQMFSFAIAVRDEKSGEIVTGSSEDRQWAVVEKGKCAEAEFFPYPPWNVEKWRTYYNVRLIRLADCPLK